MSGRFALVAVLAAGCGNLLGLEPPRQAVDAGGDGIDGPLPADAAPSRVRIVINGSSSDIGITTSMPPGIDCPGTCDFTFPAGTEVTLTGGTTAAQFTGFSGGCDGNPTCTFTPVGDTTVFARYFTQSNLFFVSSEAQAPGAYDNVEQADAVCDRLASDSGLPERKYIAWLPTSTKTAITRLRELSLGQPANGWVRPDGRIFAGSELELVTGQIAVPPRLDEFGRDIGDAAIVATDTLGTGQPGAGTHCQDWASETAPAVLAGEPAGGTGRWTTASSTPCNQPSHLYCFSAIANEAFANPPLGATVIFVSQGTLAGNAGVAAADALCVSEAQAATLPNSQTRALITPGGGKPVKDRFEGLTFGDAVMRPDGTVMGSSMAALLFGEQFEAAPNVTANRQFLDVAVRIGAGGFDEFVADCAGWTSSSGVAATRPAATTRDKTFFQQSMCADQAHILCANFTAAQF